MSKDWTEDFKLENGNYTCTCYVCDSQFIGYKRRAICRECHIEADEQARKTFEIARLVYPDKEVRENANSGVVSIKGLTPQGIVPDSTIFDPYNNWNQLMPLVEKHDIRWQRQNGKYHAIPVDEDNLIKFWEGVAINDDLQTALCESLLLVLVEKAKEKTDDR